MMDLHAIGDPFLTYHPLVHSSNPCTFPLCEDALSLIYFQSHVVPYLPFFHLSSFLVLCPLRMCILFPRPYSVAVTPGGMEPQIEVP